VAARSAVTNVVIAGVVTTGAAAFGGVAVVIVCSSLTTAASELTPDTGEAACGARAGDVVAGVDIAARWSVTADLGKRWLGSRVGYHTDGVSGAAADCGVAGSGAIGLDGVPSVAPAPLFVAATVLVVDWSPVLGGVPGLARFGRTVVADSAMRGKGVLSAAVTAEKGSTTVAASGGSAASDLLAWGSTADGSSDGVLTGCPVCAVAWTAVSVPGWSNAIGRWVDATAAVSGAANVAVCVVLVVRLAATP